jgi:hypothetical protein
MQSKVKSKVRYSFQMLDLSRDANPLNRDQGFVDEIILPESFTELLKGIDSELSKKYHELISIGALIDKEIYQPIILFVTHHKSLLLLSSYVNSTLQLTADSKNLFLVSKISNFYSTKFNEETKKKVYYYHKDSEAAAKLVNIAYLFYTPNLFTEQFITNLSPYLEKLEPQARKNLLNQIHDFTKSFIEKLADYCDLKFNQERVSSYSEYMDDKLKNFDTPPAFSLELESTQISTYKSAIFLQTDLQNTISIKPFITLLINNPFIFERQDILAQLNRILINKSLFFFGEVNRSSSKLPPIERFCFLYFTTKLNDDKLNEFIKAQLQKHKYAIKSEYTPSIKNMNFFISKISSEYLARIFSLNQGNLQSHIFEFFYFITHPKIEFFIQTNSSSISIITGFLETFFFRMSEDKKLSTTNLDVLLSLLPEQPNLTHLNMIMLNACVDTTNTFEFIQFHSKQVTSPKLEPMGSGPALGSLKQESTGSTMSIVSSNYSSSVSSMSVDENFSTPFSLISFNQQKNDPFSSAKNLGTSQLYCPTPVRTPTPQLPYTKSFTNLASFLENQATTEKLTKGVEKVTLKEQLHQQQPDGEQRAAKKTTSEPKKR